MLVGIRGSHDLPFSQHPVFLLELGYSAVHQVILLWLREIRQEVINLFFPSSVRERLQFVTSGADSAHVISFEINQAFRVLSSQKLSCEPFIAAFEADIVFKFSKYESVLITVSLASEFCTAEFRVKIFSIGSLLLDHFVDKILLSVHFSFDFHMPIKFLNILFQLGVLSLKGFNLSVLLNDYLPQVHGFLDTLVSRKFGPIEFLLAIIAGDLYIRAVMPEMLHHVI